ncbi:hypothetical protein ACH4KO_24945 [Streptomyces anulatus]
MLPTVVGATTSVRGGAIESDRDGGRAPAAVRERVDAPRARARVTGAVGEGHEPVPDRVRVAQAEHGLPGEELVNG